jgi:hypothetical protein
MATAFTPRTHRISAGAAVLGCALALAACGGSGSPASGNGARSSSSQESAGIRFSACMRAHGLPSFPDPTARGGGIQIQIGPGLDPRTPAFQAAQQACHHLLPGGGPGSAGGSASRHADLVKLAECMRSHGVTNFPDPTSSPPTAPAAGSGAGIAFGGPGGFISVPQSTMQSPAFRQAASVCGFPGMGGGLPKPSGAGTGSSK